MRAVFSLVTARPVLTLCLAGAVTLVCGGFALRLTRDTSPDAFIPPQHPALLLKERVEASFGLVEPIAVGVIRDAEGGIFNPHSLALIERLTKAIQALPPVEPGDVLSLATESGVYVRDSEPGFARLMEHAPTSPAASISSAGWWAEPGRSPTAGGGWCSC